MNVNKYITALLHSSVNFHYHSKVWGDLRFFFHIFEKSLLYSKSLHLFDQIQ